MSFLEGISNEDLIKAFTKAPYVQCPVCGEKDSCGTCVIAARSFSRRCFKCGKNSDGGKLPELDKKIIYLDQCALGLILRALMYKQDATGVDPAQVPILEKFLKAFEKLDLLNKKQQLLCPSSDFHFKETALMPEERAAALRKVNVLLASASNFQDSQRMIVNQVLPHFHAWLQGQKHSFKVSKTEAVSSRIDDWGMWINVTVKHKVTAQDVQNLHDEKATNHAGLDSLFPKWQSHGRNNHEYFRTMELRALGSFLTTLALSKGQMPPEPSSMLEILLRSIFFPYDLHQFAEVLFKICEKYGVPEAERKERIESYFSSGVISEVPFFGIASALTALVAQRAAENAGMKPDGNDVVDILFMSLFLPYTDAVLMEKKWHRDLLTLGLTHKAQVFSITNIEDFFVYLDAIEAAIPPGTLDKVREVYGEIEPYYTVHNL